ncbi:hypothetical protein BX600DRAFT_517084 [Xylariales sp. PMI_506]|nr:hypothetical protein BX600DRAFT_517084 [Xylariales sp. PMI_506]
MSSNANVNISNGTCYYTENSLARADLIPCGNIALGNWPCCFAGDVCLDFEDANACYDATTGNTYLAGCTDIGFNSRACPWKSPNFNDQEWVAIEICAQETDDNNTQWGGCKVDANSTQLEKLPTSSCDPYCTAPLYTGTSKLPAFATLPNSTGQSITWTNGFNATLAAALLISGAPRSTTTTASLTSVASPSTSSNSITTTGSTKETGQQTSSLTSTISSPTASSSTGGGGLSTGAKAGIGIGVTLVAIIFMFAVLLFLKRRRKAEIEDPGFVQEETNYTTGRGYEHSPKPPPDPALHGMVYTGFKSELPADVPPTMEKSIPAELPADNARTSETGGFNPTASPHLSLTDSNRVSALSDTPTLSGYNPTFISPQETGESSEQQHFHSDERGHVRRISELEG